MRKAWVSGLLVLLLVMLVGCGDKVTVLDEEGNEITKATTENDSGLTYEEQMEQEVDTLVQKLQNPNLKIGETNKWDNGFTVTAKNGGFTKKSGTVVVNNDGYLTIDIAVSYESDEESLVMYSDFVLYDTEGNTYDGYYGNGDMVQGFVKKGTPVNGKLYFDVKAGKTYVLRYTPKFAVTAEDDAYWLIEK